MNDLLVAVPSRGRPENLRRLLAAAEATCTAGTRVAVGLDDDDPRLAEYASVRAEYSGAWWYCGPRRTLAAWTNILAVAGAEAGYRAVASLGDDHLPRTPGWDTRLLGALEETGGTGFAYPDDLGRTDIPEVVVASADIVRALGWLCEPSLGHWYVDNVWADLGRGAGCLTFCPDVVVEHLHWENGGASFDQTYGDAKAKTGEDHQAYQVWRAERMERDTAVVAALRG